MERRWNGRSWTGLTRHSLQPPRDRTTTTTASAPAPDADQPSTTSPNSDDLPVFAMIGWLLVAVLFPTPLHNVVGAFTMGVNLGAANADLRRNPGLADMSWRRTCAVLLPPLYLVRRQHHLDRAQWPVAAWIATLVVAGLLSVTIQAITPSVEGVTATSVERLLAYGAIEDPPPGVTINADCEPGPYRQDQTFACLISASDGSSVQVDVTITEVWMDWQIEYEADQSTFVPADD